MATSQEKGNSLVNFQWNSTLIKYLKSWRSIYTGPYTIQQQYIMNNCQIEAGNELLKDSCSKIGSTSNTINNTQS